MPAKATLPVLLAFIMLALNVNALSAARPGAAQLIFVLPDNAIVSNIQLPQASSSSDIAMFQGQTIHMYYLVLLLNGTAGQTQINLFNATALSHNGISVSLSLPGANVPFAGNISITSASNTAEGIYELNFSLLGADQAVSVEHINVTVVNRTRYYQTVNTLNANAIGNTTVTSTTTVPRFITTAYTTVQVISTTTAPGAPKTAPQQISIAVYAAAVIAVAAIAGTSYWYYKKVYAKKKK